MVAEPLELAPPARMGTTVYPPQVEQWRSMAEKYFPGEVDKILYLINGESGGNPTIKGDGGLAHGLFQSHYTTGTPEEQFKDARRLYDADKANGGTGYGDWGEGRLYNGQPFGALGRAPYGGYTIPATDTTATAQASLPGDGTLDLSALTRPAFDTSATAVASKPDPAFARMAPAFTPTTVEDTGLLGGIRDAAGSALNATGNAATSVVNNIPGGNVVSSAASNIAGGVADVVTGAAREVGEFASAVPGKVMEAPYFRINPVDIAASIFDEDPTTSPGSVAASQAGPAQDQQYPAGQSLAAKIGRSVTNPINYAIPGSAALDVASAVASPIGEELAPEIGVSPTVGSLVGGATPAIAASGRNIIKGAVKGVTGDEVPPTTAAATPKDQLITHLQSAATARPDLLAARTTERGRRIANAAADLETGGIPAREAFDRATTQLGGGELASDIFSTPVRYDDSLFAQAVKYGKEVDFFTGKQASDGLKLLEQGRIPRPFEVEAIGKVFGADVQKAIEEMGDVFKVKRAVETALTGRADDVPLTLGPAGELSAENITAAVQKLLPKGSSATSIQGAVQRLINEDRLVATVGLDGKPKLRLRGPQIDSLNAAVEAAQRGVGDIEPVPAQVVPPEQPNLLGDVQPVMKPADGPADYTIPPTAASDAPTLNQQRLNRGLRDTPGTTFQGEGSSVPPPRNPKPNQQASFGGDWKPGKNVSFPAKAGKFALDAIFLLPRAIQTSYDYSYPFRQGALIGARHQKEFWPAFVKGIRALFNEDFANAHQAAIERRPYNPRTLDITHFDPKKVGNVTQMEEDFMTRLGRFIPGVRQSQRAATVFINDLRSGVANTYVRTQLRHGVDLPTAMKNADIYGNFLNRATGRGNLGNLESSLPALNQIFYGLRRNVAMVQAPGYLFNTNANVRKEVWLDFLAFLGVGAATLKIAELAGADVGLSLDDDKISEFGKIRVGNTRVDIWGGYQQLARVIYKILDGQIEDPGSSEEFFDAALPFLGNKLSPTAGSLTKQSDSFRNALYPGEEKPTTTEALRDAFSPLAWSGLYDAIEEDGAVGGALSLTSLFGTGVDTYVAPADIGRDEIADGIAAGLLPATYLDRNGMEQPVTNLRELVAADPEAADKFLADNPTIARDRYEAYGELTRKVRDSQKELFDRQTERDNTLLATNPAEWRRASSDDANTTRAYIDGLYSSSDEFKQEPKTLLDVANRKYHEAIVAATDKKTQQVDWGAVDATIANLSQAEQDLIFKSSLKGETETRKQYLRDLKVLAPYLDQRNEAWQVFKKSNPKLEQYKTFDDFRQSLIVVAHDAGATWGQAASKVDAALAPIDKQFAGQANLYLAQRARELLPLMDKYGYYTPAAFAAAQLQLRQEQR